MFHIFVIKNNEEKNLGKASNLDELLKLLDPRDIKTIFDHDAYEAMKEVFTIAKMTLSEDPFTYDVKGINVIFMTNGHEITTLVFYF